MLSARRMRNTARCMSGSVAITSNMRSALGSALFSTARSSAGVSRCSRRVPAARRRSKAAWRVTTHANASMGGFSSPLMPHSFNSTSCTMSSASSRLPVMPSAMATRRGRSVIVSCSNCSRVIMPDVWDVAVDVYAFRLKVIEL